MDIVLDFFVLPLCSEADAPESEALPRCYQALPSILEALPLVATGAINLKLDYTSTEFLVVSSVLS